MLTSPPGLPFNSYLPVVDQLEFPNICINYFEKPVTKLIISFFLDFVSFYLTYLFKNGTYIFKFKNSLGYSFTKNCSNNQNQLYKSKDYVMHIWSEQHSEKPHHSPNKFTIINHPQYLIGHLSRGLMQQQSAKYLKVYISQDLCSLYVPSKFLTHPAANGGCQLSNQQNIT